MKGKNVAPRGGTALSDLACDLLAAASLIQIGHTRFAYARDRRGHQVAVSSRDAVEWCAVGACLAIADDFEAMSAMTLTIENVVYGEASHWNDRSTKAQVLKALYQAAASV